MTDKKILIVSECFYPEEFKINDVAISWIEKGFDIELDVGVYGNQLYLGHDTKEYLIDINWLLERSKNLWDI